MFFFLCFSQHSARHFSEHRWICIIFLIGTDLLGVFGNMAASTVKLRCSLFNLILTVLDDKELQKPIPAGSCSEYVAYSC